MSTLSAAAFIEGMFLRGHLTRCSGPPELRSSRTCLRNQQRIFCSSETDLPNYCYGAYCSDVRRQCENAVQGRIQDQHTAKGSILELCWQHYCHIVLLRSSDHGHELWKKDPGTENEAERQLMVKMWYLFTTIFSTNYPLELDSKCFPTSTKEKTLLLLSKLGQWLSWTHGKRLCGPFGLLWLPDVCTVPGQLVAFKSILGSAFLPRSVAVSPVDLLIRECQNRLDMPHVLSF